MEWKIFEKALRKKIIILPTYKAKGFAKMGLFIFFNELPIPFDLEASMTRFAEIQKIVWINMTFCFSDIVPV